MPACRPPIPSPRRHSGKARTASRSSCTSASAHTVGVMQERDAIIRVAAECAEDLAADGVVYAEIRMAPELCTEPA